MAPDLKQFIMERMDEHPEPAMCRHMEHHLSSLSANAVNSLTREQRERLTQAMRESVAEDPNKPWESRSRSARSGV